MLSPSPDSSETLSSIAAGASPCSPSNPVERPQYTFSMEVLVASLRIALLIT